MATQTNTPSFDQFQSQFRFDTRHYAAVGVERESFLFRGGKIAPIAAEVLERLGCTWRAAPLLRKLFPHLNRFGYELSACQLENRVGPVAVHEIGEVCRVKQSLLENDLAIAKAEQELGFRSRYFEVGPADMPLDVYPDPEGRYARLAQVMPEQMLRAACRTAGTHVHIGMYDPHSAVQAYRALAKNADRLCAMGDGSGGERLELYRQVAPDCAPPLYRSWQDFYEDAIEKGFASNPRDNWRLVRITRRGTVEVRVFGATGDTDRIVEWVEECWRIAMVALQPPNGGW